MFRDAFIKNPYGGHGGELVNWISHVPNLEQHLIDIGLVSPLVNATDAKKDFWTYVNLLHTLAANHYTVRQAIGDKPIELLHPYSHSPTQETEKPESSRPYLSMLYKSSPNGFSEGIATFELRLNENDKVSPVYNIRMIEVPIKGEPALLITAIQRYTDEHYTPVDVPYYTMDKLKEMSEGKQIEPAATLKTHFQDRYTQYHEESNKIKKIEEKIGINLPTLGVAAAIGFAKARGEKIVLLTSYNNQFYVKDHRKQADRFPDSVPLQPVIPNIYDPTAKRLQFKQIPQYGDWWVLRNADKSSITLPKALQDNQVLTAVGQAVYSHVNLHLHATPLPSE